MNKTLAILIAAFAATTINSCEWTTVEANPNDGPSVNQHAMQGIQFHSELDNLNVWRFEEDGCTYIIAMTNKGVDIEHHAGCQSPKHSH